jgi:hypothetical protein
MEPVPDQVHLDRTYDPLYLTEAIQYFVNHGIIRLYAGKHTINLLDYFPLLKQGHALKQTVSHILMIYSDINGLLLEDTIGPDRTIVDAFAGVIPAGYYFVNNPSTRLSGSSITKITMEQAVNDGFIIEPMNTFQVIKTIDAEFNPDKLDSVDRDYLIWLNSISYNKIKNNEFSQNKGLMDMLTREYRIANEFRKILIKFRSRGQKSNKVGSTRRDEVSFVESHIEIDELYKIATHKKLVRLMEVFENDPRVDQLHLAIIRKDIPSIQKYLKINDPRDDNHKAYFLAVHTRDDNIIKMVKDRIMRKTLVEDAPVNNMYGQDMFNMFGHRKF